MTGSFGKEKLAKLGEGYNCWLFDFIVASRVVFPQNSQSAA